MIGMWIYHKEAGKKQLLLIVIVSPIMCGIVCCVDEIEFCLIEITWLCSGLCLIYVSSSIDITDL